jgi:hypothetical protein
MTDVYRELLDALSSTPGRLHDLIGAGLDGLPSGDNAQWGPAGVIAHLLDTELLYRGRMQLILASREAPYLKPFDPDHAAREHDYAARELRPTLEAFATERGETISLLMNLALKDWDRTGVHDEFGEVSIEDLAERLTDHDAEHIQQLAGMLR